MPNCLKHNEYFYEKFIFLRLYFCDIFPLTNYLRKKFELEQKIEKKNFKNEYN
jgi:hypothetical protein